MSVVVGVGGGGFFGFVVGVIGVYWIVNFSSIVFVCLCVGCGVVLVVFVFVV